MLRQVVHEIKGQGQCWLCSTNNEVKLILLSSKWFIESHAIATPSSVFFNFKSNLRFACEAPTNQTLTIFHGSRMKLLLNVIPSSLPHAFLTRKACLEWKERVAVVADLCGSIFSISMEPISQALTMLTECKIIEMANKEERTMKSATSFSSPWKPQPSLFIHAHCFIF